MKGVFALHPDTVQDHILAFKEKVFAYKLAVCEPYILAPPAELRRMDLAGFKLHLGTLPQTFHSFHNGIHESAVLHIPGRCPTAFFQNTVGNRAVLNMPQGIAKGKHTAVDFQIPSFLQCRFSVQGTLKPAVGHSGVLQIVEGPFLVHSLIFNDFHNTITPLVWDTVLHTMERGRNCR